MKIVSFNTNGIRARGHQLQALIEQQQPDIIGIQETKVQDADFPCDTIEALGYHVVYHGQKSHYGVAIMSREPPVEVIRGFSHDDGEAQRRLIGARFALTDGTELNVLNGYFPQGESRDHPVKFPAKQRFYSDLLDHLRQAHDPGQPLALLGDMNVALLDRDIGIGADNAKRWLKSGKCSFLPEERQWLQQLMDWGLVDTFRQCHAERDDLFSWFDYRSRGFEREPRRGLRIDMILATPALAATCRDAGIDYAIRGMQKPSDHCPVWADFAIG